MDADGTRDATVPPNVFNASEPALSGELPRVRPSASNTIGLAEFVGTPTNRVRTEPSEATSGLRSSISSAQRFSEPKSLRSSTRSTVLSYMTNFDKGNDLMRATPFSLVMKRFGKLFAKDARARDTYSLSKPVDEIDWFISHNWDTSRRDKFLALAFFFNGGVALMLSVVFIIVFSFLTAYGKMSLYKDADDNLRGLYCTIGAPVFYVLCVIFMSEISALFVPGLRPRVFFDKTCVHQTDSELKERGIRSIGAFLHMSRGMVIVYTDLYFQKLWTVYEVASVLLVNPAMDIVFVPTLYPKIIFMYMTGALILVVSMGVTPGGGLSLRVDSPHIVGFAIRWVCCLPFVLVAMFIAKRWNIQRANMYTILDMFSVEDAKCYCESDRPIVQGNITAALRELSLIDVTLSDEDALEFFNHMVQQEIPHVIQSLFGRTGIRYRHVVVIMLPYIAWGVDRVSAGIYDEVDVAQSVYAALMELTLSLSFWPNLVAIIMRVANCDLLIISCISWNCRFLLQGVLVWLVCGLLYIIKDLFLESPLAISLFLSAHAIATPILYRSRRTKLRQGVGKISLSQIRVVASEDSVTSVESALGQVLSAPQTVFGKLSSLGGFSDQSGSLRSVDREERMRQRAAEFEATIRARRSSSGDPESSCHSGPTPTFDVRASSLGSGGANQPAVQICPGDDDYDDDDDVSGELCI